MICYLIIKIDALKSIVIGSAALTIMTKTVNIGLFQILSTFPSMRNYGTIIS